MGNKKEEKKEKTTENNKRSPLKEVKTAGVHVIQRYNNKNDEKEKK